MLRDIIILGAGGHARVCIELLHEMGEKVAVCIGNDGDPETCMTVPILIGNDHIAQLKRVGYYRAFVAIGSNTLRDHLARLLLDQGFELVNAISKDAKISPSATIGAGIAIMSGVVVNAMATISDLAIINTGATIDHDCSIGRSAHVAPQSALAGNVTVCDFAFLGIGTKAIPHVVIGEHAVVGAGSVVIENVQPEQTVVGVPARIIKS